MKITFLGTGAADWPGKRTTEAEFRHLSHALVDGCLLIDPNPAVPDTLEQFNIDPAEIKYIINTHRHGDHFCQKTVDWLNSYGARFIEVPQGETVSVGKYFITGLKGNHSTAESCTHYIISDGTSKLFYGLDGAWLLYDEYKAIMDQHIDLAVLDCTVGPDGDFRIFEHNCISMVLIMKKTLDPYVKRFAISHMARTLHTDHATLEAQMAVNGIETAFDGWTTEF